MKHFSVFLLLFISCSSLTNRNKDINIKYTKSFDYLNKIYNDMRVSDTIMKLDIVSFTEKIAEYKSIKKEKVLDSLIYVDEKDNYKKFVYPLNVVLKTNSNNAKYTVFFSKPNENYLLAEVFQTESNKYFNDLTLFGSSDVFLFLFKENNIEKVLEIKLDYN